MDPCTLCITGDKVRLLRNGANEPAVERQVPLPTFLEGLDAERTVTTPLLPEGTRAYRRVGDQEVIVFEQPPQVRTVRTLESGYDIRHSHSRTLAFPYLVYFFFRNRGNLPNYQSRLFSRTAPLQSPRDALALPCLFHVWVGEEGRFRRGAFCFASPFEETHSVEDALVRFWRTFFWEYWGRTPIWSGGLDRLAKLDPRFVTIESWERASVELPRFVLEVAYPSADYTVQQVLDEMLPLPQTVQPTISSLIDLVMQCPET